jgi:hypothetical protein
LIADANRDGLLSVDETTGTVVMTEHRALGNASACTPYASNLIDESPDRPSLANGQSGN